MNKEVIVVVGGAGGIGSAIVKRYSEIKQTQIIVADIDKNNGKKLEKDKKIKYIYVDTTDLKSVYALRDQIKKNYGYISHLISLAGRAHIDEFQGFIKMPIDVISQSVTLNLTSHIWIVKVCLPLLENNHSSNTTVTLISSINALKSYGLPAYSSAKAGLIGFMHSIVDELGEKKIRINCVLPGTIPTDYTKKEPKNFDQYLKETAINRFATKEEVAQTVFSITHHLTAMTGQKIVIDAGQLVSTKK